MTRDLSILKNYIFYFITFLFICFIGISNVFGLTYIDIGNKADITVVLVSTDYASQPFDVPVNSSYNFNRVLEIDYIISNYNFEANKNYQLESHLTAQQLENANFYSVQGLNGESCLISYENSVFTGSYPRWAFQCPHATSTITLSIKNSGNQYLWTAGQTNIFTWSTALLKYSDTPLSTGSSDTDNIINNQNQNTQSIINNQNQNTQSIINNQNQNTQQQIESQKVCNLYDKSSIVLNNKNFNASGGIVDDLGKGISGYIRITNSTVDVVSAENRFVYACFYDSVKTLISCTQITTIGSLNIPSDSFYFRFSVHKSSNMPSFKVCTDGNQALDDSINNLNDSLNDDDTDGATSEASDFFDSFTTDTFGLTSIITAPLTLIQSLTSSTCTQLHLPLPYLDNKYLDLPCMTSIYQTYFGSFFTIYQTITYGIIAYWVCVRIFNQVKDFKNPEHDEIEVMDL